MASKRKSSYQLKLFLPITAMLWLVIIGFSFIQIERERSYRTDYINSRIDLINKRILNLCDNGQDPSDYMRFVGHYFDESTLDNLSITLYDLRTGSTINRIGFEAPAPRQVMEDRGTVTGRFIEENTDYPGSDFSPDRAFYYYTGLSGDGTKLVQTILPYDSNVSHEVKGNAWWWAFIIGACILVTLITWGTTHHLSQNVKQLRNFAHNAAHDAEHVNVDEFANDELGEISREIVNIYNTRKAAIASRELEHRVALKATEERNQLKRQLTNNINHEIKTPATVIKGYVETILDNPDMDADARIHFLTKIRDHVERLCSILNDLSTMTRLEEGSSKVRLEGIDFKEFVEGLAEDIVESGLAGDMEFKYDIPDNCIVKGNPTLLLSALSNLIKNAAAYSRGTEMGIRLLSQNRRFYTFVFYDNGVGVAEEHIPMLFDRFYRIDKGRSRKMGGTGLGLPIVRSSMNTIGGSVSVRNGEHGGLEFVFTLGKWNPETDQPKTDDTL